MYVCLRSAGQQDVSLKSLEERLPIGPKGVSLDDLRECGREEGVSVTAMRADLKGLTRCRAPAVLHVNNHQFVAFLGMKDGRLLLFDNAQGLLDCTPEWFTANYQWDGVALMFGPLPPYLFFSLYAPWLLISGAGMISLGMLVRIYRKKSGGVARGRRDPVPATTPN